MCRSPVGFINRNKSDAEIQMGNGKCIKVEFEGDIEGEVVDIQGHHHNIVIRNVSYVPGLQYNLFSTMTAVFNI